MFLTSSVTGITAYPTTSTILKTGASPKASGGPRNIHSACHMKMWSAWPASTAFVFCGTPLSTAARSVARICSAGQVFKATKPASPYPAASTTGRCVACLPTCRLARQSSPAACASLPGGLCVSARRPVQRAHWKNISACGASCGFIRRGVHAAAAIPAAP